MASTIKADSPAPGADEEFDLIKEYQVLVEQTIKTIAGKDKKLRETMKRAMVMSNLGSEVATDHRQFPVENISLALTKTTDECFELMCRQELLWFMKYTEISRGRQADFNEAETRYQQQLHDSDNRWQAQNDAWKTETKELQDRISSLEAQLRSLGLDLPPAVTLPASGMYDPDMDSIDVSGAEAEDVGEAAEFEGLAQAPSHGSGGGGGGGHADMSSPTPFSAASGREARVSSPHVAHEFACRAGSPRRVSRDHSTSSLQDTTQAMSSFFGSQQAEGAATTATHGEESVTPEPDGENRPRPASAGAARQQRGSGTSSPAHAESRPALAPARKGSALARHSPPGARRPSLSKTASATVGAGVGGGGRHARRDSLDRRNSAASDNNIASGEGAAEERLQGSPIAHAKSASNIEPGLGLMTISSGGASGEEFEDVGL